MSDQPDGSRWERFKWNVVNVDAGWRGMLATFFVAILLVLALVGVVSTAAFAFKANVWFGLAIVAADVVVGFIIASGRVKG